jgi:L-seryl-tRNA(Ser) seleniumtransferase
MRLPLDELAARSASLVAKLVEISSISAGVEDGESVVGGGSTPGQALPTKLVTVHHSRLSAQELEAELRRNWPPVIARVERDRLLLDLRTVFKKQDAAIVQAFERLA